MVDLMGASWRLYSKEDEIKRGGSGDFELNVVERGTVIRMMGSIRV